MIRRPPRSTLFPYTTPLPIFILTPEDRRHHEADRSRHVIAVAPELVPRRKATRAKIHSDPRNEIPSGSHRQDRKSTRLNSSHANISYAVFCLKKKKQIMHTNL